MVDFEEADHLPRLAGLQSTFTDLLRTTDPSVPVPGCGDWTVRELTEHLGSVHLWAARKVGGAEVATPPPPADLDDRESLAWTYAVRAELLQNTFAEVPADHPCETMQGQGAASFWHRRQAHETLIHLWDLCQAVGAPMPPQDPSVWADCVDEVVQVMHPRQISKGRAEPPEDGIALVAEDADRRWEISGRASAAPAADVSGSARELALLLWGRRSLDDLSLSGDRTTVEAALAGPITP
ncbi:maleylpyruvate isomerase family mycothiol-dependent enzyme [Nesterenkonia lutea]|uniref:Uncharacterized protein (TIGR03083 family) n=1 Tax=Nesterenkonia lutea TaxID=272919 RepID=A0ABR9JCN8_9MICC|nr:maleylpyruvate isomerase family mycothiol-dependent enzyme [Nesterenkonia lutea]MBE1523545.1 uncharacterized protein (TIGR03083 family) [Nesterenkonia lutea]